MWNHCLECRQMVCNHHNMGRRTLLDAFPDKVDTGLVHPVELLHPQQLSVAHNLTEVIHAFPHEILIVRVDPRPQRTHDKVGVVLCGQPDSDNSRHFSVTSTAIANPAPSRPNNYNIRGYCGQSI